jgi:enamine deaminase RidA (YjgF/YER057c/UK114 family)
MTVSIRGASGTTSPLHNGQWLPHPAPDPLARTKAPHRTTRMFHASTPRAARVKLDVRVGAGDIKVAAKLHLTANHQGPTLVESWVVTAMQVSRTVLSLAILLSFLAGGGLAQKKKSDPDEGYIPVVAPDGKKKKKKGDEVLQQTLPPPPELPSTVSAETQRLAYQVTPLSSKGLLSEQTRDALKVLLKSNRGPVVKLRAFVAGSGDLRRIGEIAGETFQEKHLALPALSVVQVGALPLEGAQVIIEATEVDRKVGNPAGVAFLSGQAAASVAESLEKLKVVLAGAGMQPDDALSVTCFVSSLDGQRDTRQAISASFPSAALNYVQMQRGPVMPAANCEAIARLRTAAQSTNQAAIVTSPQVIITGTQLAFGNQDSDFKLAYARLEKTLAAAKTSFDRVVMAHLYITAGGLSSRILATQGSETSAAKTLVPVEALPSLDAAFGIDVVATAP